MQRVMTSTTDPRPVAVARIGLGIAAGMMAVEAHLILWKVSSGRLAMPTSSWIPDPSGVALLALLFVALAAAAALTVGYRTALAAGLVVVTELAYFLWDQQTYSSHRMLLTLLVSYLAFARSDVAWSVRPRARRAVDVPYWPQLLMMSQLSVLYLFAGLSKVNPLFLQGHMLAAEVWWPLPSWLLVAMSVATVVTEIFLAVALWLPRMRWPAAAVGLLLHLSIVAMLRDPVVLIAFALACVPLYPLFLTRPHQSAGGGSPHRLDEPASVRTPLDSSAR